MDMEILINFDFLRLIKVRILARTEYVTIGYYVFSCASFADDVIEAADGSLYFSIASTKFGLHDWYMDMLEARPHGQLLRFDPSTNQTSLVLDNLNFANGVALSKDQDFLIVCETFK